MSEVNFFFISLLMLLNIQLSYSQNMEPKKILEIDSFFNKHIKAGELAGAITLISEDHKVIHLKSYGYLDIESSIPMRNDVIIPIASMTKIITNIAVIQLFEAGKLHLDDPVEKYIPEFKNVKVFNADSNTTTSLKTKPTIRDLMRHTSGMVYSFGNSLTDKMYVEAGFREWNKSLHEFIIKVTEIPFAFQPNEGWAYSYSHDILGYIIEVTGGMPLNQYFMKNIFEPLKLKSTDFYVPKEKVDNLSNLYNYDNGVLKIDDYRKNSIYHTFPSALSAGGGWWSSYGGLLTTIDEFYIVAEVLLNYGKYNNVTLLQKQTVKMMISNQIGNLDAYGNKYGLGVGIETNLEADDKVIYWAGSPYNTYFWINYKYNRIGILFTNTAPFGHLEMMDKFKELVEK